jgi:3-oxoacyl-[acyl-carrier protein] reductase
MDSSLKQALVTGSSRGIGAAIARRLAAENFHVWLNYRSSEEQAAVLAREICDAGHPSPLLTRFDVSDRDGASNAVQSLIDDHGAPDVLVVNAGIRRDGLFVFTESAAWDAVLDTNLGGFFSVAKPVVKAMLRRRSGRVILISSVAAQRGSPGQVNYAASKGALISAGRSLALEVAPRGITVNVVAPGLIETEMIAEAPVEKLLSFVPVRRLGKPEEVAHVVAYLCSPEAAFITGQVINVNGGMWV